MISVIVPAYNTAGYIGTCVKSVLRQSYRDFELILVNDGSTDTTEEICRKLKKRDRRIRVLSCAHRGVSAARNAGIKAAEGEYLFFLDSDDAIHHGLLEALYRTAEETKAEITACRSRKIDSACFREKRGQAEKKELGRAFVLLNNAEAVRNLICVKRDGELFMIGGKLIRRDAAARAVRFDERLTAGEDTKYLYQILEEGGDAAALYAEGYFYRIRRDSVHRGRNIKTWRSQYQCEIYLRDREREKGNQKFAARKEYALIRKISEQYVLGRITGNDGFSRYALKIKQMEKKSGMYSLMGVRGKAECHLAFHCYPVYYLYYKLYHTFCRIAGV